MPSIMSNGDVSFVQKYDFVSSLLVPKRSLIMLSNGPFVGNSIYHSVDIPPPSHCVSQCFTRSFFPLRPRRHWRPLVWLRNLPNGLWVVWYWIFHRQTLTLRLWLNALEQNISIDLCRESAAITKYPWYVNISTYCCKWSCAMWVDI